jgi:hypothetical protein
VTTAQALDVQIAVGPGFVSQLLNANDRGHWATKEARRRYWLDTTMYRLRGSRPDPRPARPHHRHHRLARPPTPGHRQLRPDERSAGRRRSPRRVLPTTPTGTSPAPTCAAPTAPTRSASPSPRQEPDREPRCAAATQPRHRHQQLPRRRAATGASRPNASTTTPSWFPIGHVTKDDQAQAAYAKSICRPATSAPSASDDAVDNREPYGIWGGLDENERHGLHRATARASIGDICGNGGGRTAHRRAGTPVCPACLTYENRMRVEADLRRWDAAAPLIASGLTHAEAGAQLGVTEESVRRAYNAAQRQATQAA